MLRCRSPKQSAASSITTASCRTTQWLVPTRSPLRRAVPHAPSLSPSLPSALPHPLGSAPLRRARRSSATFGRSSRSAHRSASRQSTHGTVACAASAHASTRPMCARKRAWAGNPRGGLPWERTKAAKSRRRRCAASVQCAVRPLLAVRRMDYYLWVIKARPPAAYALVAARRVAHRGRVAQCGRTAQCDGLLWY